MEPLAGFGIFSVIVVIMAILMFFMLFWYLAVVPDRISRLVKQQKRILSLLETIAANTYDDDTQGLR